MWALLLGAVSAQAQFAQIAAAPQVQAEATTNLFATWEGYDRLDGVVVDLPPGWRLQAARILRDGYDPIAVRIRRDRLDAQRFVVESTEPIDGYCEVVLQVETGTLGGSQQWAITPFRARDGRREEQFGWRAEQAIETTFERIEAENPALHFAADRPGAWLLEAEALPDLGTAQPTTVAFWLKTLDLDAVILSTWNGSERQAYPLELVLGPAGHLVFYRGEPGRHQSMQAPNPVADGQWHHIALTHDPDAQRSYLFVDGVSVDSLFSPTPIVPTARQPLALGGRLPADAPEAVSAEGFVGVLDELRIWAQAYGRDEIRRTMRQTLDVVNEEGVALSFAERIPSSVAAPLPSQVAIEASDLVFFQPVRNLRAEVAELGLALQWETEDAQTERFVVERSTDGRRFDPIGDVAFADGQPRGTDARRFSFQDEEAEGRVVFYRIRQVFTNGTEQYSGILKMGMGRTVTLTGNYPNPFNPVTTITYTVREQQAIRVSVWDLAGQQVAVLVDEVQPTGAYEVQFEARDLPSGTYFVRLQTGEGLQTHKIILTK